MGLIISSATSNSNAVAVVNDKDDVALLKIWVGTQAEFDALGTKDMNTLYFVT